MPLYFNNSKILTPIFNGKTLSVVKYNDQNVLKNGNVNFTYTLSSQMAELNAYASDYYVTIKNTRTGDTKNVGGSIGTTSISIPAIDGDKILITARGYYEGGSLSAVSPLQRGISSDGYVYFIYPLNDADIAFSATLNIRGYYDSERRKYLPYEGVRGTITANYYVNIQYEEDD